MKRVVPLALATASMVAFVAAIATVRGDRSADSCFTQQGDAAIASCTRAIRSGRFSGAVLATIYQNRAIELRERGDYDKAIADYSEAIRIDGGLSGAFTGRGLAYEGKAEVDKAKADYRKALTLASKYDDAKWAQDTARQRLAALGEQVARPQKVSARR
ncbi:MAG TPA: tetratricopeptide repeat protein [Xanthobacteraceae bacterium]|nr:tetratricopeptide repeat protein [Xanthobacteraceae bacterium]